MSNHNLPPEDERSPRKLYRAKLFSEVPKGAVLLSKAELLQTMYKRIEQNKNVKKIWPLKYNYIVTGGLASLSGAAISSHYRKMFKLMDYARPSTYGIPMAVSAMVALRIHSDFVTEPILTGYNGCELCLGLRSGAIQIFGGIVYPLILSPLICVAVARSYHTYSVPSFKNTALFVNMIKTTFPLYSFLGLLAVVNLMSGMFLCEAEMISYEKAFGQSFNPVPEKGEFFTDLK